jgi:hypothetical protein
MKTHRDRVLYITAANIMWSDPKTLNPTYLRSLIKPERFIYTDLQQWRRTFSDISVVTHKYSFLILVNLMLAILLLLTTSLVYHRLSLFYFILFESSFWILNIMQTYTAKINDRSFAPYLSLLLFCHVVLLLSAKGNTLLQRSYLLLSAALILLFIQLSHLKTEAITLNSDLQKYQYNFKKIKAIATNKHLALNGSSIDYLCLSNTPFHPFDFSAFKRVYITDGSIIPFLPYYKDYLESECRCDIYAFPSFWNYLHSIRQETIIVSTPERLQIAKDYLREIHHFNLTVTENTNCKLLEARKSENRENPDQLKIYTIENDSTADYLTK